MRAPIDLHVSLFEHYSVVDGMEPPVGVNERCVPAVLNPAEDDPVRLKAGGRLDVGTVEADPVGVVEPEAAVDEVVAEREQGLARAAQSADVDVPVEVDADVLGQPERKCRVIVHTLYEDRSTLKCQNKLEARIPASSGKPKFVC